MPKLLIIFVFALFSSTLTGQQIEYPHSDYNLTAVLHHLETDYSFFFSYKTEDVTNLEVSPPTHATDIDAFLKATLHSSPLTFIILDEKRIVLSPKNELSENISPERRLICGTVRSNVDNSPLAYANVYLKGTTLGTTSDENGLFSLKISPQNQENLIISFVGFEEKELALYLFTASDCPTIHLDYLSFKDDLIIVTDYLSDGINLQNNGDFTEISPDRTGILPGQSEADVLKALRFLPGVNSPDGTLSNLNIRGGTSDQNLTLWEEIPIYHSAHHFGLVSAFNTHIIDKVKVYRGGFSANYGGRISAVIDMSSPDSLQGTANFGAGFNMINAYTYAHIPLSQNRIDLTLSARRSLPTSIKTPTFNNIRRRIQQGVLLQTPMPNRLPRGIDIEDEYIFTDINAKLNVKISNRDKLKISGFYASNDFDDFIQDTIRQGRQANDFLLVNRGFSANWEHLWHKSFVSQLVLVSTDYNSKYRFELEDDNRQNDRDGVKNSSIAEQQLHFKNKYSFRKAGDLTGGLHFTNYKVSYDISQAERAFRESFGKEQQNAQLISAYGIFETHAAHKAGISAGLRFNYFNKTRRVYTAPRMRLWYRLAKEVEVHARLGRYFQYLSRLNQIQVDDVGFDTPVWVLAGEENTPIISSDQLQTGVLFRKNKWLIDLQAYLKRTSGISSLATGFDEGFGRGFHLGDVQSRGIDILIRKNFEYWESRLAFSLSSSTGQFPTFFDKEFSFMNEQRQVINWVNVWNIKNFSFALGLYFSSGLPHSDLNKFRIVSLPADPNTPTINRLTVRPVVNDFNSLRLPWQHRADASITYKLKTNADRNQTWHFGLSLFNIYNRRNIYNRSFFIENRPQEMPRLIYIDRVDMGITPDLSIRFSW